MKHRKTGKISHTEQSLYNAMLGSIELDRVINDLCYNKGIILYRNNRKMTILEPRPGHVITKTVL